METAIQKQEDVKLEGYQLTSSKSLSICHSSLSPTDRSIIEAASNYPQIRNIKDDVLQRELKMILVKIQMMYGIKGDMAPELLVIIQRFLMKHYSTSTLQEIMVSAEINLSGQLGKKIESFGQTDIPFITDLLNNYRLRKMEAFKELKLKAGSQVSVEEKKSSTPEENYLGLKDFVDKYGDLPIGWDWSSVFDHMWAKKLFTETPDQMKAWFEKESARLTQELEMRIKTASSLIDRRNIELQLTPEAIRAECRKIYISQLFMPKPVQVDQESPDHNPSDIKQMAINWQQEFELGKDADGFINYKGYDLSREDFIQTKINETTITQ